MAAKLTWPTPEQAFVVPLYGGRVYLYRKQEDYRAAQRFLKSEESSAIPVHGRCTHLQQHATGDSIYLIGWFNNSLGTLIHESAHLTFFLLEHVGIKATDSSGEPFAYLQEALLHLLAPGKFAPSPRKPPPSC